MDKELLFLTGGAGGGVFRLVHHGAESDVARATLRAGNRSFKTAVLNRSNEQLAVSFRSSRRGGFFWKTGCEQSAPLGKRYLARGEPVPAVSAGAEVGGCSHASVHRHHYILHTGLLQAVHGGIVIGYDLLEMPKI